MVQLSHLYMTTGQTIALTIWTIVGKVMSLLFNTLSTDRQHENILFGKSKNLTLKELSELLNRVNLSIYDYYRYNGINNNEIASYAPIVNKVDNGSIIVEIVIAVFSELTAILFVEYLKNRFTKQNKKKDDNAIINVNIEAGNVINIYIANK